MRRVAAVAHTLRNGRVTATLAPALPSTCGPLLSFQGRPRRRGPDRRDGCVAAARSVDRERARAALAERGSALRLGKRAERVIAAAEGRLDTLPYPASPTDNVPAS